MTHCTPQTSGAEKIEELGLAKKKGFPTKKYTQTKRAGRRFCPDATFGCTQHIIAPPQKKFEVILDLPQNYRTIFWVLYHLIFLHLLDSSVQIVFTKTFYLSINNFEMCYRNSRLNQIGGIA